MLARDTMTTATSVKAIPVWHPAVQQLPLPNADIPNLEFLESAYPLHYWNIGLQAKATQLFK